MHLAEEKHHVQQLRLQSLQSRLNVDVTIILLNHIRKQFNTCTLTANLAIHIPKFPTQSHLFLVASVDSFYHHRQSLPNILIMATSPASFRQTFAATCLTTYAILPKATSCDANTNAWKEPSPVGSFAITNF